ncbi:MAG: YdcF family protein [Hyphomicrobiaceae bacterium]|nr:YdcF family protein [Hyphomicrobiaceae bacterium]
MLRLGKTLLALGIVGCAGLMGFVGFAEHVRHIDRQHVDRADGIIVLTGDEERISTGMLLMEAGYGRRLLISGVHPATRVPTELKRYLRGSESLVKCCVDMGREALNTSGNAEEARQWAVARGFSSLIVVTSGYHMARSLTEFRRAMPGVRLSGFPAASSRHVRIENWWRHWPTARLLAGEYVKLLGASARYHMSQLLGEGAPSAPLPGDPPNGESRRTIGAVK